MDNAWQDFAGVRMLYTAGATRASVGWTDGTAHYDYDEEEIGRKCDPVGMASVEWERRSSIFWIRPGSIC